MYAVRENLLYMLSFEKFMDKIPVGNDNNDDNTDEKTNKYLW